MDASQTTATHKGDTLHRRVLIGLLVGAALGLLGNWLGTRDPQLRETVRFLADGVAHPIGQVFLRLLFLVVVPLVFAALAASVARLGTTGVMGRMGVRTAAFFLLTTAFSVVLGLTAMHLVAPGRGFDPATSEALLKAFSGEVQALAGKSPGAVVDGAKGVVNLVLDMFLPRNMLAAITQMQMLPLILFSLLFGAAIGVQAATRRSSVVAALDAVSDAMVWIVDRAMRLAPVAVACLIFVSTSRFGLPLLGKLSAFVGLVIGLYLVQLFVFYPVLLSTLAGRAPGPFLRKCLPILAPAFSTSSSNATLPVTLERVEQNLGVSGDVAGFVLPLGATINMDGTSLYQAVATVFIAQAFGVPLDFGDQLTIVLTATLASIGSAGVPGAGMVMLVVVLESVGLDPAGIALIMAVDRILDMARTVVNVSGDAMVAVLVARKSGDLSVAPAK